MLERSRALRSLGAVLGATLIAFVALTGVARAAENDRVALVFGNSNEHLPPIPNPTNDAKAMAAVLWQAGFETIEVIDANRETMLAAIATFAKRLQPGTDAVFFYAGHGVQSGGANYLLPVTTSMAHATELAAHGIDANEIALLMANSGARFNVLILDACRDNPFAAAGPSLVQELAEIDTDLIVGAPNVEVIVRSSSGLAPIRATRSETIVGFSTSPGEVALDGTGKNSPYTSALLEYIDTPGLEVDLMFRRVRAEVREQTKSQQIPWVISTLENEFYFRPAQVEVVASLEDALEQRDEDTRRLGLAPPKRLLEDAFWRIVTTVGTLQEFEAYLERYPDGEYAEEAREAIARIEAGATAAEVAAGTAVEESEPAIDAFLGVGPVPIDLAALDALRSGAVAYEVRHVPTSGTVFRSDGTPVKEDHLLAPDQLAGMNFVPMVGTKSVACVSFWSSRRSAWRRLRPSASP